MTELSGWWIVDSALIRQSAKAVVVKIAAAGLSLGMLAALARPMSPEEYGRYAFVFSLGALLSTLVLSGLHIDILRRLAVVKKASEAQRGVRAYLRSHSRALGLSMICTMILILSLAWASSIVGQHAWPANLIMSLAFGLVMAAAEYLAHVYRGLGSVILALAPRDVMWRISVIIAILVALFLQIRLDAVEAVALSASLLFLSICGQLAAGLRCIPKDGPFEGNGCPSPVTVLWQARWLSGASLVAGVLQSLSVVVVGGMLSYVESGMFFAAQKIAALLSLPLTAVNMIGATQIAQVWASGDRDKVRHICSMIVIGATVPTIVGAVFVIALSSWLMSIFNDNYHVGSMAVVIMSIGHLINSAAGPTGYLMLMTGHEKSFIVLSGLSQATGIVAVAVGSALWGLEGAAFGEMVGIVTANVTMMIWARNVLGIDPTILSLVGRSGDI